MKYMPLVIALAIAFITMGGCSNALSPNDTVTVVDRDAFYSFYKSCVFDAPNFEALVLRTYRDSDLDRMVSNCHDAAIDHATITTTRSEMSKHSSWVSRYDSNL